MRRRSSWVVRGVGFGVALLAVLMPARAADRETVAVGRPAAFEEGKRTMVAVWYERDEWHIRATSKGGTEVITGKVTIQGGKLSGGNLEGFEQGPPPPKPGRNGRVSPAQQRKFEQADKKTDKIAIYPDKTGFEVRLVNYGKTDGLNFKVTDKAKSVTFNFRIGGDDNPKQVVLGADGVHPDKFPFVLPAHPKESK
jgi:hypothetical protein